MLATVAPGVHVHESGCIQSNTVVVEGDDGVLVVDPGITRAELRCLAGDLRELGLPVVAGFSTHPDWDHVLWHPDLGEAPRYGTVAGAAAIRAVLERPDWVDEVSDGLPPEVAGEVPMELFGSITPLGERADRLPWDGPTVRVLEHRGHAPGHAALLVEERGVLVAGDMLSDVLVPMPDLSGAADPLGDYAAALDLFDRVRADVTTVVPGHGSVGGRDELAARISADRAYIAALRAGEDVDDPRIGPHAKPGWEWVVFVHDAQVERLRAAG